MVKIRYAELPAGLHVATEAGDRCTIVYLKPGLTRAQRKDALTVARRTARFGHGPSLPTVDMAFAIAADRTRTSARIFTSAMRKHPLLLLPLAALLAGIIAAGVLASAVTVAAPPPRIGAAPSNDLSQPNIGQLVNPRQASSPGPSLSHPSSVSRGGADNAPVQSTSHGRGVRHGKGHSGNHPAAGVAQSALPRQSLDMSGAGQQG
ncbi:MAG TPA: hypothetical protein VH520_03700 [Streptosporangiaceae bacterium]|jgi:hypothetical protein